MKPSSVTIHVDFTLSKILAFCILIASVGLDMHSGGTTAFLFAVPFVSSLILGKQYLDSKIAISNSNSVSTQNAQQASPSSQVPPATPDSMG